MIIKNISELDTSASRRMVLEMVDAGIARVLPSAIMQSSISYNPIRRNLCVCGDTYSLSGGRIFVIGGGKASCLMAENLENLLGTENIIDGIVTCKDKYPLKGKIRVCQAGHPVPDLRGVSGVKGMLRLKEQYSINKEDMVICLISGGGSALMPYPADGIRLEDKQTITGLLLASGADIHEINSVRKHLSKIKGGRLGKYYSPATVISLILSDVIGNDLSTIASGPTVPDTSTFAEAYGVLQKYDLISRVPVSVKELLNKGCSGQVEETPKKLENCHNYIIGDNTLALEAMARKAYEMGLNPKIVTSEQQGNTSVVARSRAEEFINKSGCSDFNVYLLGGETTLQLPAVCGTGGRNQHYAAVSLAVLKNSACKWTIASVGTDGSDYLPEVAGAIVDNNSLETLKKEKIDIQSHIDTCDSHSLLKKLGNSLIETGSTGTNVGDVMVYLINSSS